MEVCGVHDVLVGARARGRPLSFSLLVLSLLFVRRARRSPVTVGSSGVMCRPGERRNNARQRMVPPIIPCL
jgi:hypothetical protein